MIKEEYGIVEERLFMHIQDLTDSGFGTVITDVDLAELRDEEWEQIYRLWNERAPLIFQRFSWIKMFKTLLPDASAT